MELRRPNHSAPAVVKKGIGASPARRFSRSEKLPYRLDEFRDRLEELPKTQQIVAYCQVGMRGYLATRILLQNGFPAANLSGGYTTWMQWHSHESK